VLRGGAWNNNPTNCRAANRNRNNPDNRNNNNGFRLVVVARTPDSRVRRITVHRSAKPGVPLRRVRLTMPNALPVPSSHALGGRTSAGSGGRPVAQANAARSQA